MHWNTRTASAQHHQWYKNLVELHELTNSWLRELRVERQGHFMTRGLSQEIAENFWMLESMSNTEIEGLLDDTGPNDTLGRLEHTVWSVQAWTLRGLLDKTKGQEKAALRNVLEQIAWRMGRQCAEQRWAKIPAISHQISTRLGKDLRGLLIAFNDSPMSGYPFLAGSGDCFLVKRATQNNIELELKICPHQIHYEDVRSAADELCELHSHWMRGYAYALNNRISMERVKGEPRCLQRWFFVT